MDKIRIDADRLDRLVREHNEIISDDSIDSIDLAESIGIRRALRLLGIKYQRHEDGTITPVGIN